MSAPTVSLAPSACEAAIASAAAISDIDDQVTDLDPAIKACGSLAEFARIAANYPTALDEAPPELFVSNRCECEPTLATTPICEALK